MHIRVWAAAAVLVVGTSLLLGALACSGGDESANRNGTETSTATDADRAVAGSFVGQVSGMDAFVAVVAAPAEEGEDERAVQMYVSDGADLSEWLSGSISDNSFDAKSEGGTAEAEGDLRGNSVKGTLKLSKGKTVRYNASRPGGAAGLYELTVSSAGKLKGASAAGLAVKGELNLENGTGTLRLADGQRLEFEVTQDVAADLAHLRRGQVLVVVLPGGELRGAGTIRPAAGTGETAFLIRSSSS